MSDIKLKEIPHKNGKILYADFKNISLSVLENKYNPSPLEEEYYNSLRNEGRKKEFLGARILKNEIIGEDYIIEYNSERKPTIKNSDYKIYISHTNQIVAVSISKIKDIAIDMEKLSTRVERVKHKFLSELELAFIPTNNYILNLYKTWCIKECLIKLYGKKSIDLTKELFINKFEDCDLEINAYYSKLEKRTDFVFKYKLIENEYLIVFNK
ncbi:MAG: 4'-phosphopantetheinyl transferase superfamily protein [Marinifilaceae bacterium]|jgi:phosphopantetheinyl transferase|nr:4'-phosphopantetheinyl transferase superfamily protein [Marinifilaceae bacterium]